MHQQLTPDYIRNEIADTDIIYKRGERLFEYGACAGTYIDAENGCYEYMADGNYGDYFIEIQINGNEIDTHCDCPYPGVGCKHTVAALLDISQNVAFKSGTDTEPVVPEEPESPYLGREEIRAQAIEDRKKRARSENLKIITGDMFKGEHIVETPGGRQYTVTVHDPESGAGHCSCPDFESNRLQTCKHLIAVHRHLQDSDGIKQAAKNESFPFVDIYWDAAADCPRVYCENPENEPEKIREL
ncbi:MAG: SWIM zinc finger family protein, partial [Thermodesulfobacteriota bacterium]